jgi:Flp pilus assembly protein TadD
MLTFATCAMAAGLVLAQVSVELRPLTTTELSPPAEEAFARSLGLERERKLDAAIAVLERLEDAQRNVYLIQVRLGLLNYNAGKYDVAQRAYAAAVGMAPSSKDARNGLILSVLARGNYSYAETLARQVLEIQPDDYYANLRLAYALRMQGKFDEATAVDTKMLTQYPTDISFLLEHGLTLVALKHNNEARTVFSRVILLDPDNLVAKAQLARPTG